MNLCSAFGQMGEVRDFHVSASSQLTPTQNYPWSKAMELVYFAALYTHLIVICLVVFKDPW